MIGMESLVLGVGRNGPILLFFITIFVLQKQPFFLSIYLVCFFVNDILNKVLKQGIRERRPYGYETHPEQHYFGPDRYGMPSGHSQSVFFSLMFTWVVTGSPILFLGELCLCLMTVYQRWAHKKHSPAQLLIGSLIGSLFAIFVYYMANVRTPQWKGFA